MTNTGGDRKKSRYEQALEERLRKMETRHSFDEAEIARTALEDRLFGIDSRHQGKVSITCTEDKSDLKLVVQSFDPLKVPKTYEGLSVELAPVQVSSAQTKSVPEENSMPEPDSNPSFLSEFLRMIGLRNKP